MDTLGRRPLLFSTAALFLLLALAYSFSIGLRASRGAAITGDEPFYLLTTQSLIDDGDLDLTQQYERRSYTSFFDHPSGLWRQSVPTSDGKLLSPHEPGLSVLLIPGFAIGGRRGAQTELALIAALTFSLAFLLTSTETAAPRLSWLTTAAVGLAATPFVYASEVYPEVPAALCIVAALLLLRSGRGGVGAGLALTLLLSGLAWLGMKYLPLGAIVAVAFLAGADNRARFALVGLSALSGVFYVWFHYAVFENLTAYSVNTVYEGADAVNVLESHVAFQDRAYRLWGLLIDQRFGVGRWAPLLLLLPAALPLLANAGGAGRVALALIGAQVLIATFVAITMMGWWFPGRTLMVVLPLTPLALTLLLLRLPSVRPLAAALALLGLLFTLALRLAVASGEVTLAVDPFDLEFAPFRVLGAVFPSYQRWTTETVLLTVAWLVVIAGSLLGVAWSAFRNDLRRLSLLGLTPAWLTRVRALVLRASSGELSG